MAFESTGESVAAWVPAAWIFDQTAHVAHACKNRFNRDSNFLPTILERYSKYVATSNRSAMELNAPAMDTFCDNLATTLSLAWSQDYVLDNYLYSNGGLC